MLSSAGPGGVLSSGNMLSEAVMPLDSGSAKNAFNADVTGSHFLVRSPCWPSPMLPDSSSRNTRYTGESSVSCVAEAQLSPPTPVSPLPSSPPTASVLPVAPLPLALLPPALLPLLPLLLPPPPSSKLVPLVLLAAAAVPPSTLEPSLFEPQAATSAKPATAAHELNQVSLRMRPILGTRCEPTIENYRRRPDRSPLHRGVVGAHTLDRSSLISLSVKVASLMGSRLRLALATHCSQIDLARDHARWVTHFAPIGERRA